MKIRLALAVGLLIAGIVLVVTAKVAQAPKAEEIPQTRPQLNTLVGDYLKSKQSPLAPETEFLLQQEHWKLLIAISAIESQYCTKQLGNNCWGIGGDSAYRHYSSVRAAVADANDLIESWQNKGRWLTVEDMNCHYVQPCNPNWVVVVNKVLGQMEDYERQSTGTIHQ